MRRNAVLAVLHSFTNPSLGVLGKCEHFPPLGLAPSGPITGQKPSPQSLGADMKPTVGSDTSHVVLREESVLATADPCPPLVPVIK